MQDNAELIEKYHSIKNFKDKYIFYQNHHKKLRFIEPLNPLMKKFIEAGDDILKHTKHEDRIVAEMRKDDAIQAINNYYKDNDLEEPKPSNDVEGGQVVEYWVNSYNQQSTFEDKKREFLESIEGKSYANEIISTQIEILQLEFNKIKKIDNLNISLSETYNVDFTKIYEFVRIDNEKLEIQDPIKAYTHPIFISHESLAKAIPLIQYKKFLEDHLNDDVLPPQQANSEKRRGRPKKENPVNDKMYKEFLKLTTTNESLLSKPIAIHRLATVTFKNDFGNTIESKKGNINRIIRKKTNNN